MELTKLEMYCTAIQEDKVNYWFGKKHMTKVNATSAILFVLVVKCEINEESSVYLAVAWVGCLCLTLLLVFGTSCVVE